MSKLYRWIGDLAYSVGDTLFELQNDFLEDPCGFSLGCCFLLVIWALLFGLSWLAVSGLCEAVMGIWIAIQEGGMS